jgi:hypothetical protein
VKLLSLPAGLPQRPSTTGSCRAASSDAINDVEASADVAAVADAAAVAAGCRPRTCHMGTSGSVTAPEAGGGDDGIAGRASERSFAEEFLKSRAVQNVVG